MLVLSLQAALSHGVHTIKATKGSIVIVVCHLFFINRAEATSICRKKGMGDNKIQELMSKLKGGGNVSLESLEGLLGEFAQQSESREQSETNSCELNDAANDENIMSSSMGNGAGTTGQAIASTNGTSSRGTNFLELANTVSSPYLCCLLFVTLESIDLFEFIHKPK